MKKLKFFNIKLKEKRKIYPNNKKIKNASEKRVHLGRPASLRTWVSSPYIRKAICFHRLRDTGPSFHPRAKLGLGPHPLPPPSPAPIRIFQSIPASPRRVDSTRPYPSINPTSPPLLLPNPQYYPISPSPDPVAASRAQQTLGAALGLGGRRPLR